MRARDVLRAPIVAFALLGATHGAGCGGAPHAGSASNASSSNPSVASPAGASMDNAPPSAASTSPSWMALPPLPPPSTSTPPSPPRDQPHVAYRGADPFEAPPSAPLVLAPTPQRPAGTDPSPQDRASYIEYCGQPTECGVCNNYGRCGFCMASKRCVPKDAHGAFPGTCVAGFTPDTCHVSLYIEREEPKLRAKLRAMMKDLAPEGMPIDNAIDGGARAVRIPVRRGYCYALVFRTSYDVDDPYALNAAATPEAAFLEDGGDWVAIYTGASALTPFCPQTDGQIVAGIVPDKRDKPLKGTWRVQLFRKSIAIEALREQAERVETEHRQRAVRYVCGHCTRVYLACRLTGTPQCTARFAACLESTGLRPDDCERGDVPRPPKPKPPYDTRNQAPLDARAREG